MFASKKRVQTISGALLFLTIFFFADIAHAQFNSIVAYGDINAAIPTADVGEDIPFWVDNFLPTVTKYFLVNFHDGTPYRNVSVNEAGGYIYHSFPFEGKYTITMITVSNYGITSRSYTGVEIINQQPQVSVILPLDDVFEGDNISLSIDENSLRDTPNDIDSLKYQWRFGDGTTGEGKQVYKVWNQSSTYTINVYVADDQAAVGYASQAITVLNKAPVADFSCEDMTIGEDHVVFFDARKTIETLSDKNTLRYYWNFGDGRIDRSIQVPHEFLASGTYPVNLTVIDNDGARSSIVKNVVVNNEAPTSSVANDSLHIREGDTAIFNVQGNDTFTDQNLLDYSWSFGSNGSSTTHQWLDDGNEQVYSIVSDPEGSASVNIVDVLVDNTNPYVIVDSINAAGMLSLRMAGTPNNTLYLRSLVNGKETGITSLTRHLCSPNPNDAIVTLPFDFDLSQDCSFEVFYGHGNAPVAPTYTQLPSGEVIEENSTSSWLEYGPAAGARGANPTWLTITFADGVSFTLFNVFWILCNDTWVWRIDPKEYLATSTLTIKGHVLDRGQDNLTARIQYGSRIAYFNVNKSDGRLNFTFTIHGWDNWISYWEDKWFQWWSKYDEFWSSRDGNFDAWCNTFEMLINIIGPHNWYNSFVKRFEHNKHFLDHIFKHGPWQNCFEYWYNNWSAWWIEEWHAMTGYGWKPVEIEAWDGDGGYARLNLTINSINGKPAINNTSPRVSIDAPGTAFEDTEKLLSAAVVDYYNTSRMTNNSYLKYTWDFGDGTNASDYGLESINHVWTNAGTYMVQLTVFDGEFVGVNIITVIVANHIPEVSILGQSEVYEDQFVQYTTKGRCIDTVSDMDSMRFIWTFDDGTIATGETVNHTWASNGTHHVTVKAIDNNCDVGQASFEVIVKELLPDFYEPYGFNSIEGNAAEVQIAFKDNILDELDAQFIYTIDGTPYPASSATRIAYTGTTGDHEGTFKMVGSDHTFNSTKLGIMFTNQPPSVFVASQAYYGPAGESLNITAYGIDVISTIETLTYTWNIAGNIEVLHDTGSWSNIEWTPSGSGDIIGTVEVTDGRFETTSYQFYVKVSLDDDLDEIPNEVDFPANNLDGNEPDSDGDMLTDGYEYNYIGTKPNMSDTDGDKLWDGIDPSTGKGELYYNTDPLNNDTDGDGLLDGDEVTPREIWVLEYGQTEEKSVLVISSPLLMDTDGDGLTDLYEFQNGTNPSDPDTDHDGNSDFMESTLALSVDNDKDRVPDVYEILGFDLHLANNTVYKVFSDPTKNDTDMDGLTDWEEWNFGADGYKTDPSKNDTDGDGLLDSQEVYSKGQEYGQRIKLTANVEAHFYFRAYFAPNLMNVSVTIGASVGEDGDAARFTYRVTFGGTTVVENNTATGNGERYFFNATDVTEETNGRADGYWHLYIKPHGRDALLEIFKIEGVARLNPVKMDTDGDGINDYDENFGTNGYMTDPSRKDTDADGWDDSKEIFETLTNPLDSDSDGDGVIDNVDNAPLGNLILEVKVIKGYWADTPYDDVNGKDGLDMQVVTKVGERTAPTPKYSASDDATTRRLWIFSWNAFCGTWFTSGGRECKYYYDIPDEQDQVLVQMQYWHIWWGWADVGDKILDASRWYDVDPSGAINPDFKIWAGSSWVQYEIRTIQLNKTNTIAVFKDDSTFANKHYSTIGQQNLIMLNVSGSNDYFVDGLNTVVVPSEIFVDTTLHAEIEKSMGSDGKIDTSLLPSGLLAAKFQGIDRTEGTVSRHIESVITVEDEITIGAAQAILDDLLELANDINVPDFFKVARVNPCNISLASDVIDFLPWDGAIMDSESDTGLAPKTLGDAIIGAFIGFGLLIYGGIVAIVGFLLIIWYFIVQIGLFFVGIFQDAIEAVEKAVKAIILVLLYLLFAINLLMIITFFMVFLISFYIFAAASEGAEAHDGLAQGELWVTLKVDGKVTLLELLIQSIMVPWLEVKVPDIHVELTIAGVTLLYAWLGIGALIETGTLPVSNAPTPAPMPPSRSQTRSLQMLESSNSSEKPIASSKSLATPLSGISSNGYTLTESAPSFERNLDIDGNGNEEECYVSAEGYSTAETLSYYYTNNRASATLEKLNELTFNVMLSDTTNFKSGWLVFDECGTNEITEVTFPASSGVQEGDGFIITRQNGQKYYVWLNKGSGTSPTYTSPDVGVEVFISPSATAAGVASAVATALMAISTFADGTGEIAIFNYADGTLKFTQKVIGDTRDVALIGTSVSRIVTRQGSVQAGECEETILGFNSFSGSTQGDHVLFESQDGLVFSIWLDKGDGGSTPSGPVHTKVSTIPIAVSITSSDTAINVASNVVSALRLNELFSDRVTIVDNLDGTIKLTQNSIGKTIDARSENEAEDSEYPPGTIQVTISNNGEMNGMISLGTPSSNVYKPEINLAEIGKISQDDYSNDHQDLMYRYRFVLNDGISFVDFTPSIRRIRIFQNAPPYIFAPRHVDSLSTPPEFRDYKQKFKAFLMDLEGDNPSTGDVFEIKIYDNLLGDSSYDKPFPFAISPDEVENDFVNGVLYEAEAELPFGQSYYSIYYKQNTHLPVIEILDPVGGVLRYQFSHIVLYDLANFNFGLDLTLGCAGAFLIFLCLLKECIDKPSIPWWVGLIALVCTFVALFLPLILSLIIGIGALNDGHYDESNDPRSPASLFFGVAIGYWILFFCMLYAAYLKRAENISNVWAPLAGLLEVVFGIASDTLAGGSDAAQTWELILGGGGIFLLGISLFTIDMNGEYSAGQSIARFLAKLTFVLALVATGLFVTSALIQFYNPV